MGKRVYIIWAIIGILVIGAVHGATTQSDPCSKYISPDTNVLYDACQAGYGNYNATPSQYKASTTDTVLVLAWLAGFVVIYMYPRMTKPKDQPRQE